jgi:hypothetical protein
MLVEAASASMPEDSQQEYNNQQAASSDLIPEQKVDLSRDEIILECIKFEDDAKNESNT